MVRRFDGPPMWRLIITVVATLLVAVPVAAQQGGRIEGVVTNVDGEPVEGVTVVIEGIGISRRFEAETNRRGEFLQIGLTTGSYRVSAESGDVAAAPQDVQLRTVQRPIVVNLVLGMMSETAKAEAVAKNAALNALFQEGIAASNAKQYDTALAKFQEGIAMSPDCFECYNNIGYVYAQQQEYDQAEAAYKKSVELEPNDFASYNGLANLYNAQRKFDLAAEASAKATELSGGAAAGGGGAEAHFNQGVILWNAGKTDEARASFEAAIAADPNHSESHFQLGMALVNAGELPGAAAEFQKYLELAPEGPNAATASALLTQLNP